MERSFRQDSVRAVVVLALILCCGCNSIQSVTPLLYRSRQPTGAELWTWAHWYQIKGVVNLRGAHPNEGWWEVERAICSSLSIDFRNVSLPATRMPTREEVLSLLDTFDSVKTPVLIHCKEGADRTSLASYIWLLYREGMMKQEARQMMSIRYGHLGWLGGTGALDKFVKMVPDGRPEWVRAWIETKYMSEP